MRQELEPQFTKMFGDIGYHRIRRFCYKSVCGSEEVEHVIEMEVSRQKYLGGMFCIRNPLAAEFSFSCLKKFGDELFSQMIEYDPEISGGGKWRFPADGPDGQLRTLDLLATTDNDIVNSYHDILETEILPFLRPINSLKDLYRVLIEDKPPFDWTWTNSALRVAEIFSIGRRLGDNSDQIFHTIEPYKNSIPYDAGISSADFYLEAICQEWNDQTISGN